jgi:quercetin dioxygenase-like cupin family protein
MSSSTLLYREATLAEYQVENARGRRFVMFRGLLIGLTACVLTGCAAVGTEDASHDDPRTTYGSDEPILQSVRDIEWQPGPASLEEGAEYVVLEGDPSESGLFVMRLRLPDGFVIRPHTHPNFERVTVISGTFHLGHGATFDRDSAHRLDAGSFTAMPPGMEHFAFAEGETVLHLTSIGPWDINYIDPADDPRQ